MEEKRVSRAKVLWQDFAAGLYKNNPIAVVVLGMCPTLAVSTAAVNGIAMGLAATFVLVCSSAAISMLRNFIPSRVRIPAFIVVIASFVTVVDLFMNGFVHELWKVLGVFIPLIVVNCIIMGRAEAFASKNTVGRSIFDALGMGVGFTLILIVLGSIRELLGNGTVFGFDVIKRFGYLPLLVMILPPGAYLTLGLLVGLKNKIDDLMGRAKR
ncbi:MAG: RnfABCDGE type electron transport complex subunit E [bacterium]